MFRPIDPKADFPALEERILRFWREARIFQRSVEQRQGGPKFILYEGPPTVNAPPGIHHVLSRVFKDVFPRYKALKGFHTPRIAGWDTHGLPVELGIEERLGFTSKTQIEAYGIGRFNQLCRESVTQNIAEWNRFTERIGFWVDVDHPYITFNNDFIESCWWLIKQLWDRGLVYQGYRVTPHCPRCGTSLSSHEVALGYKDDTPDPSVYVKFRIVPEMSRGPGISFVSKESSAYLLAWTTTPWTLTANVALAVNPHETYVRVRTVSAKGPSEELIMARKLLDTVLGAGKWEMLSEFDGKDLIGIGYERLFEPRKEFVVRGNLEGVNRVVAADFVSMEDGTGIVHIAPAYGQDDYDLGMAHGLAVVHTVDLDGSMRPNGKPWDGKFIKEADPLILQDLKARGLLHRKDTIKHTYPFCWRCHTPLVYYAKPSWYIKTTARRDALLKGNERINWYPDHIKHGRFGDWLENNVDWAFSRERYWGTPLPVWRCKTCGRFDCIGGFEELEGKPGVSGIEGKPDFHRPWVDGITFRCACGGTMQRVPEVIDCWFDSGAMPFAQFHYPFENASLLSDGRFPADYICEAIDQTRGWFYSLHAISILLFDQPSFKNVICLGHILDAEGEKMSKSRGNVVEPWQVINRFGADAVRWYLLTAAPPGNVRRFSADAILEGIRRFHLTLWNTYAFFVTYANIDRFDPRKVPVIAERGELDRWILSELNRLIESVDRAYENYDATGAGRKMEAFVDNLSNWYVRRSRRRFWKSENDADKLAAHATLYDCLITLAKLLAPLVPFLAEEIYQNLVRIPYPNSPESVHLTDFPVPDRTRIDERLSADMDLVIRLASLGRSARSKAGIKVRQPLEKMIVKTRSNSEAETVLRLVPQLQDELNVKSVLAVADESALVDFEIKPNLALLGRKYGRDLGAIRSALAGMNPQEVAAAVRAGRPLDVAGKSLLPEEILVSTKPKAGYAVAEDGGYTVGVSTDILPELAEEGLARELVHRLQTMRRAAGFEIADYIETYYRADEPIRGVVAKFADYIRQETLSRELVPADPPPGAYVETHHIEDGEITLGVKR